MYVINEDRFIDLETESDITNNDIQEYIENLYQSKLKSKMSATVDEPVSVSESEIDESSDVVENSIEQENTDAVDTDTESTEIIRNEPLTEVMNETPDTETSNNSEEENSESVTNSFFIDDEELLRTVCGLLKKEKYACASAYLKAISMQNKSYNHLYTTLGYAMNDPALSCNYTSSVISGIFDNEASDYSDLTEFSGYVLYSVLYSKAISTITNIRVLVRLFRDTVTLTLTNMLWHCFLNCLSSRIPQMVRA